eukprot:1684360-Pleurochrysis_carterae.AAC.1
MHALECGEVNQLLNRSVDVRERAGPPTEWNARASERMKKQMETSRMRTSECFLPESETLRTCKWGGKGAWEEKGPLGRRNWAWRRRRAMKDGTFCWEKRRQTIGAVGIKEASEEAGVQRRRIMERQCFRGE